MHESFVTLREGMKMARRNAGRERDESENVPEAICERVMPWKMKSVWRACMLRRLETCERTRR